MIKFISREKIEALSWKLIEDYYEFVDEKIRIPIPVHDIADLFLELNILYKHIEENDKTIWAGLNPSDKSIIINEFHYEKFEKNTGFLNFTIAHEIGHWELHSDKNENIQFNLFKNEEVIFCRDIDSIYMKKSTIEIQADLYAASLLMPKQLLSEKILSIIQNRKLTYKDLYKIKDEFEVSISALVNRINSLKLAYIEGKNIYSNEEEKNGQLSLL